MAAGFSIQWRGRDEPRQPMAVVASNEAARQLAHKILGMPETALSVWEGVSTQNSIILLGQEDSLPWVGGVSYLGVDPAAPHLLLPTNRDPGLPLDLLEQALLERSPFPPPLAFIEVGNEVVSLSKARQVSHAALARWLSGANV